jgi:hypothetical protein
MPLFRSLEQRQRSALIDISGDKEMEMDHAETVLARGNESKIVESPQTHGLPT